MIPGANLLNMALGVIAPQPVLWSRFTGRTVNAAGFFVAAYADAVALRGSLQPVPTRLYQSLGLDFGKKYATLYTPAGVVTVDRDGAGDKLIYQGETYLCESSTDWAGQDGWSAIVAVRVPQPAPTPAPTPAPGP
jgi:hypothetical protein